MIRIAITQAAFDAITQTLPLGTVAYEAEITADGERLIWIDQQARSELDALRGPEESYSDVILRLIKLDGGQRQLRQWRKLLGDLLTRR